MKNAIIVIGVICLTAAAIIFAPIAGAQEEGMKDKDSLFQKMSDLINGKYEVKTVPYKTIDTFQDMSNGIKEGSEKAKHMSLRTK